MDTKGIRSGSPTDRISNLPCNVIDDILKYLPLDDAVRTSILSREWRYKWRTTPYLVFDMNFNKKINEKNYDIDSIIYYILSHHKRPIVKFTYEDDRGFNPHWLHLLSKSNHRIEELTLQLYCSSIPHHLLTFRHLKHLKLRTGWGSDLILPTFKGFDRLVSLDLHMPFIEPADFRTFISKCPMLAHLSLVLVSLGLISYEIDAPNLKSFSLFVSYKLPSICFKNTSLLEEVSIWVQLFSQGIFEGSENLIKFCGQLSSIKNLKLNDGFLQFLSAVGIAQKLPSDLSHLIVLRCEIDFRSIAEVSAVVCLIRSSPNLQRLEIESRTSNDGDMKPAAQFLKEQQNCKLSLSHLENVNIVRRFKGLGPEMEFVKLILSTATSLIKLKLDLDSHLRYSDGKRSRLLEELAKFSRASSKAVIFIS